MLYALLRAMAGIALRWYYRSVHIEGSERVPQHGSLLVVVNHPNALVDAMLVAWAMPRRVLLTAKSTIFVNPLANLLLKWVGVVPLYRASDVQQNGAALDPSRNRGTFRAVIDALRRRQSVLIFPEGKTHDDPSLAPLKSGAARLALEAVAAGATDLVILPIGLVFEQKDAPRSRVVVEFGAPLVVADWPRPDAGVADGLTREIDARLRAVTENYESIDDAARARRLSSMLSTLFEDLPNIGDADTRFLRETTIAKHLEVLVDHLERSDATTRATADQLIERLDAVQRVATSHHISLVDVPIPLDAAHGARFVAREGWVLAIGAPIAAWGRINHWLPFTAARAVAMRSVESAADPAMRTVVAGAVFVVLAYLVQTVVVGVLWGPTVGAAYLASLPLAAEVNFYLTDRFRRASQRARAFLLFRRDPALRRSLSEEIARLRKDVVRFDASLRGRGDLA